MCLRLKHLCLVQKSSLRTKTETKKWHVVLTEDIEFQGLGKMPEAAVHRENMCVGTLRLIDGEDTVKTLNQF